MKKRWLSILLAAALLLTSLVVATTAVAEQANLRPGAVGSLETDGARIEKYAEATGNPNEYILTLMAEGKDVALSSGADIVLVIDASGSMDNSLDSMKEAAYKFVDQLLVEGSPNRIGVVEYAYDGSIVSELTGYQAPQDSWQQANRDIKEAIGDIEAYGATNTQAGLYVADQMLAESSASNKYVVLLSDGDPTYNYKPVFGNLTATCTSGRRGCKDTKFEHTEITGYDTSSTEGDGSDDSYNSKPWVQCNRGQWHQARIEVSSTQAAYYEANIGKQSATYYTIGYNVGDSTRNILKNIASKDDQNQPLYSDATTENIQKILNAIGVNIAESIRDTGVTDPMGSMVDLVYSGSIPLQTNDSNLSKGGYYVTQGTVEYDAETETFEWEPGVLKQGDTAILRYKVTLDVEAPGFSMDKAYPGNGTTTFSYTRPGESSISKLNFKVPTLTGTYGTYFVRGYLVNNAGQPIQADGTVTSREQAAVVYGATPVINPRNNNNQWAYGSKTLEALPATGYTLYGSASQNATITPSNSSATVWFAYTLNETAFTVEHYFENYDGSFTKDAADDSGSIAYGQSKYANEFVRTVNGYTYNAGHKDAIGTITYTEESQTGLTLKLYYTLGNTDLTVQYQFIGGPKDGTTETKSPSPSLRIGSVVDANDYKLTTAGEYANYEYVDASYSGLGEGNVLTATPGGKVVLTYKYAEINVQVIHRYPGLSDVKTYDEEHYLNSTLTVPDVAEPVTYYNGVLYAVSGTAVTVGGSAVTPSEGQISLTGDAVITITYEVANSGFTVEHYFEKLDGTGYDRSDNVDSGSIQFGETKNAVDFQRDVTGFTYDPTNPNRIDTISFLTGTEPTGRVLKLYYTRNATTFEIQHYYQNLDGSFNTAADETVDGGAFQFGETKNASDYVNTGKVGFTYDASVDGSVTSISYLTAEPTGRVLKLYYTRNATTFEIQHYYQNLDGSFNTAADETVDGGAFQFGETKNASDYVNTGKVGFTYDASVDGSIASISYLTATPTGRVLKLYYTRNEIEFTVEHYFEQLATGEYEKAQPAAEDSGVLKFDDVKNASDFVRTVPDYTYDPTNANAISTIRYNANGTPDGTVLKLYYTLDTANLTVEYNFIGGPKNGTTEPLTPSPVLKIGTVVNANDYLLTTTGEYANYSYVGAAYSGLGTGNKLVSGSNGKVVLTYKYAEVNVQVIHKYPGLEDVKTYDDTHFMDTDLTVSSIGNPITYYNNTLYTVVGTTVTVGGQTVTPSNDKVTLTGDTVITITYEVATANFTVEHYFEDEEGNYDLDSNIDSGSIRHGDTKTAAEFVRTVTGYTYNAAHTDAVSSITFSGEEAGEMVLKLYYDIHVADYTVEHYFEKLDGSGYDKTETEGPFDIIFGQVKKADGYAKTVEGFTYDKTVSGSVAQITYDDEPFTNNVLKLYYTRNETTFEIQHFYQNLDGSFNRAADETVDGGAFRYGETKNASDYVNTGKIGFTYDAGIDGSIASISYLTAEPTGRVLKLYYTRNATTFEIQHFYQKVDGSFNAAADVTEDGGVFQFGSADKKAADYIRPVADYTYDASNPNRIDTISYQGAQPTGRVLKLYYNLNTTDLTVQYAFIGGPKDSKVETLDPSPELRIGTVVDADNYKLDTTGEYANYSFVSAEYSGLGENNQLTSTPGGKVVLTYRYAEVNVQVIHKYPALADVKTYDSAHFLDSQLLVSSVGNPVTYYNNTLYTVSGTAVTVGGEAAEPVDGKVTLTGDAVIVITYEVANANFTVEHYFQDANGSYNLDTNMDSGSIQHGDTKNAGDFVRSKAGYTYNPEHAGAVNSITFSGETAGEMVLKLYYDIHKASFKAEHYFEQLDGSFVKDAQDDEGEIIFGQSKEASEFVRTAEGFTYDASASGAVNKITYDVDPLTGNVLKLYYTRNEQNFTVEHYFEQTDGTYRLAASTDDDSGVFQYGETKNAADFVRTVENYTYDAQNANAVNTISYEGAAPTGTVLKLYYNLERYTLTIRYVYENGSTAAETVTQELPVGDSYSVDSPVIEGYAVDMETVSGVMPGADVIVVVTYRAEEIFDDPSVPLGPPESEETSSSAVSSETSSADSSAAVEEMPDDSVPLANPKTGDIGTSMAVFAAILSVGAAAAAILRKKKKDENND